MRHLSLSGTLVMSRHYQGVFIELSKWKLEKKEVEIGKKRKWKLEKKEVEKRNWKLEKRNWKLEKKVEISV